MHPADIKAAIEKAGSSQRDIAHECKVTPSAVAHVIYGRGTSLKVAEAVARVTGYAVSTLWPDKYMPANTERPKARRRLTSTMNPVLRGVA